MLALVLTFTLALASDQPEPVFDPRVFRSPNGRYALVVDPTTRNGAGPGRHTFLRDGVELRAREEPFTLHGAAIGDDGMIAGYAYTHGERDARKEGSFVVAISSRDGLDLKVVSTEPRVGPRFIGF